IRGSVAGDIVVVGPSDVYDSDRRTFKLGGVSRDKGGVYPLHILVKGPHAKDIKLSVGEVDPADVLQCVIDTENPSVVGDSGVRLYPMQIRIEPGARAVSRLGTRPGGGGSPLGKIVIETTHPQTSQVLFYVQFAVEG
ncbi:MAG: hypothetical protein KDA41_22315, partial [Planctomycetales bacterium]|nr:hypothetical protein [Planctomycetales bacterium]